MLAGSNLYKPQKAKTLLDSLETINPPKVWAKFNQKFEPFAQELAQWGQKNKDLKDKVRLTSADEDNALEQALKDANWDSEIFKDTRQINALNLFEQGRITWQQKATTSDIVETARYFGPFVAYPILTPLGDFSAPAFEHLLPLLVTKSFNLGSYSFLELTSFCKLVQALPLSEQYFFVYHQQKMDKNGSFPSKHNALREEISNISTLTITPTSGVRFTNLKYHKDANFMARNITYQGILKLSYGAENALGLVTYGQKDWVALIPCIDRQTINDVDRLGQANARPTLTAESKLMGMIREEEITHEINIPYPDVVGHDHFHREMMSLLGRDVYAAFERIIQLARNTFGIYWSKDIWLLRDFNVGGRYFLALKQGHPRTTEKNNMAESTARFSYALLNTYGASDVRKCTLAKKQLEEKLMMFDENQHPHQIALCFIIDLVMHPKEWAKYSISDNAYCYHGPYCRLIQMAQFLNKKGVFQEDMKENILKFDAFIKTQNLSAVPFEGAQIQPWQQPSLAKLVEIIQKLNEIDSKNFEAIRDNSRVFLGFEKKSQEDPLSAGSESSSSNLLIFNPRKRTREAVAALEPQKPAKKQKLNY